MRKAHVQLVTKDVFRNQNARRWCRIRPLRAMTDVHRARSGFSYNPGEASRMLTGKNPSALLREAAADLWHRTLAQIPSLFGRLLYLSSLRSWNTGRYEHHGFAQEFGEDAAHEALFESHERTFAEWLRSPLEEQKADLDLYLAGLTPDRAAIVDAWLNLAPYRNLVPASARDSERDLFATDFEALLELLRKEYKLARRDPEDWVI